MDRSPPGKSPLNISPVGFGAFKIGRNVGVKYPAAYDLPSDEEADTLLNGVLDLGINLIDTAPAYGTSEERIGRFLSHRRREFILSTKVGETFEDGRSTYDFSRHAMRESIERSLRRLRTDVIDVLLLHSDGRDALILHETDAVDTLHRSSDAGHVRLIGLSAKTVEGARAALEWADVLMVEYHLEETSNAEVMREAHDRGVCVLVKKGLASGTLAPDEAIRFVLSNDSVDSLVIGGLRLDHLERNLATARSIRAGATNRFTRRGSRGAG